MQDISLQNNVYWQLLQVAITNKHNMMTVAEKYGLSVMQLYTLCLLGGHISIPMNSLSGKLHCDASNVTGIVDRLFMHNFIKREENTKDRREKMIALTAKGAKLCKKISDELASYQPEMLKILSGKEKLQLQTLLHKMLRTEKFIYSIKR